MSGILNSKERIFDTIVTKEGLKQASSGRLKAEFVSFTDSQAIYNTDTIVSGGLDATYRFVLEAGNFPQDQITLEADDSGFLRALMFSGSQSFSVSQGQVLSGSGVVSGSQFASLAGTLLSSSVDNFKNLYVIQSPDPTDRIERQFLIGPSEASFTISENNPIPKSQIQTATLESLESFFYDKRLSHMANFQFMPPVNKPTTGTESPTLLGEYINLNQEPILTYDEVDAEIRGYEQRGFSTIVRFYETSNKNNLFGQFFELSNSSTLSKLDVVDFGEFQTDEGIKHVFFVGKVFISSLGSQTFVNLFTLVFEQ